MRGFRVHQRRAPPPEHGRPMWFGQPLDAGLLSFGELDKHDETLRLFILDGVCRVATNTDKRGDTR